MFTWASFLIVITWQLLIFLVIAWKKTCTPQATFSILWKSLLIGLPFGVVFDLVVGEYLGIFSYELGFGLSFLMVNGIFSYGLWIATITLFSPYTFKNFIGCVLGVALLYEIVNFIFPVWYWTFLPHILTTVGIVLVGYIGLSLLVVLVSSKFLRVNFRLFK